MMPDYMAAKDDRVDRLLGKYIKSHQEAKPELKIMFVRIKPNQYYFGYTKVSLSLDNSDSTLLNVELSKNRKLDIDSFLE